MARIYYVDLPEYSGRWQNVGFFDSKSAAIEWIRESIDPSVNEDGWVCLISEDDDGEEEPKPTLRKTKI